MHITLITLLNTRELRASEALFISGRAKDSCQLLTDVSCQEIKDVQINLEEADTRIILHAACAKYKGTECILVYSTDTDVLVLLVHHLAAIGLVRNVCEYWKDWCPYNALFQFTKWLTCYLKTN